MYRYILKARYAKILLMFLSCFFSCENNPKANNAYNWMQPNGKIKVLSTIAMIGDLVETIGGEHVDNLTLITGELDPHSYQLVKGDDEKFAFAAAVFFNGLGLEHGPSLQRYLQSPNAISLGDKIKLEYGNSILQCHNTFDPHIWMDISLWSKTVPFIVEALSKLDPANESIFRLNGDKLIQSMQKAHLDTKNLLMEIPEQKRYLVTSHDAFNYFTRAYLATEQEQHDDTWHERFAAPEGLAPESQLCATDIQHIINHLQRYNIHVLFPESNVSRDSIKKIVSAGRIKGLNLHISTGFLYGDAMGVAGTESGSYLKMIEHNAKTIKNALMEEVHHD